MYRRAVKRSGTKKYARKIYKATGLVNPVKRGRLSSTRLAKDVAYLKHIINSEKFRLETKIDNQVVAQCNVNASGHYLIDVTPIPSQGDGYNNRQGNSMKWVSSHYSFFFQKQSALSGNIRGTIEFIQVIGEPFTNPSNILGRFIEPNRWVDGGTIYDVASDRKPEYFKNFRVIRKINFGFKASDFVGQQLQKVINTGFTLKNHHVKFNNNSNTISSGQILMLIRTDTGNCSTTSNSTLDNVSNLAQNTGLFMSHNRIDYYYDN